MRLTVILLSVVLTLAASCDDGSNASDAATGQVALSKGLAFLANGCISLPQSGPVDCVPVICPGGSPSTLVALDLKESLAGASIAQFFGCSCRTGNATAVQFDYPVFKIQVGSDTISGEHLGGKAMVTGPQEAGDLDSCPTPVNGARADQYAAFYGKATITQASAGLARYQGGGIFYSGRSNYYHAASNDVPPRFTGVTPASIVISPP